MTVLRLCGMTGDSGTTLRRAGTFSTDMTRPNRTPDPARLPHALQSGTTIPVSGSGWSLSAP